MAWQSAAAYVGLAGVFLFALITIMLHAFPTGCNVLRNPVSDFARSDYRVLMIIAFLLLGIGILVLDAGLGSALGAGKRIALGVFFIGVFGASRLLVAFFPSDVDGTDRTAAGRIHSFLTAFGFLAIPLATIVLTPVFERIYERAAWSSVFTLLRRLELAVVVLSVVLMLTRMKVLRSIFGLVERLFYISALAWVFVLGLHFALLKH